MGRQKRSRKIKSGNKQCKMLEKRLNAVHTAMMASVTMIHSAHFEMLRIQKASQLFRNHLITKDSYQEIIKSGVSNIRSNVPINCNTGEKVFTTAQELDLRGIINTDKNKAVKTFDCHNIDIDEFKETIKNINPPGGEIETR